MTSKLAIHLQAHPAWASNTRAAWIKVMDPPADNRWPGKRIIGRVYMPDGESNALVAQGAAGADAWFAFCQPTFARAPYIRIWEGPNEPQPVADLAFCRQLAAFTERLAQLMHGAGLQLVGGNLSEGNPGGDDAQRRARFQAIARGLAHCDYWSQHCYWVLNYPSPEAGMNEWHAFRYRLNVGYAREAGITLPPLLITECGVDGGVVGIQGRRGWRTLCNGPADYLAQLAAFDAELARDPYVLAATIFTAGPMGWEDFEVTEELSAMLNAHIDNSGGPYLADGSTPPTPPTPPQPGPGPSEQVRVYDKSGMPQTWEWLRAKYNVELLRATTGPAFLLSEVRETEGPSVVIVKLQNEAGLPISNTLIALSWPDAPEDLTVPAAQVFKSVWRPRAAVQVSDGGGQTGFGLGTGSYYDPRVSGGPHVVWVLHDQFESDGFAGLGMLPGTNHMGPLRLTFTLRNLAPVYGDLPAALRGEAERNDVLSVNPHAALCRAGAARNLWPTCDEFEVTWDNVVYVAQRFRNPRNDDIHVLYCVRGDWGNIRVLSY